MIFLAGDTLFFIRFGLHVFLQISAKGIVGSEEETSKKLSKWLK
jgi:hypothetical protein